MIRSALSAAAAAAAALLLMALPGAAFAGDGGCVWNALPAAQQQTALEGYRSSGHEGLLKPMDRNAVMSALAACGAPSTDREAQQRVLTRFVGYVGSMVDTERLAAAGVSAKKLHSEWIALPAADRDLVLKVVSAPAGSATPDEDARAEQTLNTYMKRLGLTAGSPEAKLLTVFVANRFLSAEPI